MSLCMYGNGDAARRTAGQRNGESRALRWLLIIRGEIIAVYLHEKLWRVRGFNLDEWARLLRKVEQSLAGEFARLSAAASWSEAVEIFGKPQHAGRLVPYVGNVVLLHRVR